MSTRCQVQVIQEGLDWDEKVTLYHHTDGYPSNMIEVFKRAFNYKREPYWEGDNDTFESWRKGRAGKVASYLCWADPGIFEPKDNHRLHRDIEYFYRIFCTNSRGGDINEKVIWEVEIYTSHAVDGWWTMKSPTVEDMNLLLSRTPLNKIDGEEVEREENELFYPEDLEDE